VKPTIVVPLDPAGGGVFDVGDGLVRAVVEHGGADAFGFVQPVDRLHQRIIVCVADGPDRRIDAGIDASIGVTGSSYDNALAETINGLYKTELIKPRGPWRTLEQVEIATLEWVDWFNNRRIYEHCGDMPPAELETLYYQQNEARQPAELSN